jgi:hypothetical protein
MAALTVRDPDMVEMLPITPEVVGAVLTSSQMVVMAVLEL